ncbi:type II toxin-antitoxin system TacA family antitoxin [Serratia quinivorans]|uniref:type II toxin-antitoxin system TacA family antitoxin n=1 Tax=Serratia quinivorans TaxID=137545 RepID=UPI003F9C38C0
MSKVAVLPADVKSVKNARVELKTSLDIKDVLREAASAAGLDLSAFILNAALERAESVLDNQRRRQLSAESWQQVNQLLSEPAAPTLALQALMRRKNNGKQG